MFLLHCISLITVTSSAHLLSNLRHFFSNCFKNKMPCVPMQLSRMSSVVASGSHFIFLTSDTSCEINTAPRWALLVCQQSSHQSFSNAKCGNPVSLTACVCLLSCSVPLSLFGFFFCFGFPAPFPVPSAQWRQPWLQNCTEHRCWNCQKVFCGEEMKFNQIEGRLLWWKHWMGELIMFNFTNEALHQ